MRGYVRLGVLALAAAISIVGLALRDAPELTRGPAPPVPEGVGELPMSDFRAGGRRIAGARADSEPAGIVRPEPDFPGELLVEVGRDGAYGVGGRTTDRDGLRAVLADHADRARDENHRWRASERRVRLRVEPGACWEPVLVALQVCSAPDVRIWRIRIGVGDDPAVDLPLDRDRLVGYEIVRIDEIAEVQVTLKRLRSGGSTRVVLMDRPLGQGEEAWSALELQIESILRRCDPEVAGLFRAWPAVPVEDVMRLLRVFSQVGHAPPRVEGAPPESWRAEDLRLDAERLGPTELLARLRGALRSKDPREVGMAVWILEESGPPMVEAIAAALAVLPWREDGARELPLLLRALLDVGKRGDEPVDLWPPLSAARAAVRALGVGEEALEEFERRAGAPETRLPDSR